MKLIAAILIVAGVSMAGAFAIGAIMGYVSCLPEPGKAKLLTNKAGVLICRDVKP